MAKRALITGITGQDGSYLAELLLGKGYAVHGIVRRTSNLLRSRIEHLRRDDKIYDRALFLHYGDLADGTTLRRIFREVEPDEVYHLAGQSHVGLSFDIPESTCEEAGMATLRLLEIVRDQTKPLRFYHASSSEIFGNAVTDLIMTGVLVKHGPNDTGPSAEVGANIRGDADRVASCRALVEPLRDAWREAAASLAADARAAAAA